MADLLTTASLARSEALASIRTDARGGVPRAGAGGDRAVSEGLSGQTNFYKPGSEAASAARLQPASVPSFGIAEALVAVPESVAFHAQLLGQQVDASREPETKSDPVWTEAAVAYRRTLAFSDAADALAFAPRGRIDAGTGLGFEIDLNG